MKLKSKYTDKTISPAAAVLKLLPTKKSIRSSVKDAENSYNRLNAIGRLLFAPQEQDRTLSDIEPIGKKAY